MPTIEDIRKLRESKTVQQPTEALNPEQPQRRVIQQTLADESKDTTLGEEEPKDELSTEDTEDSVSVEEEQGDEVQYFNELPETMGWDPEQFYNLKLKTDSGDEYTWSEIKDKLQSSKQAEQELEVRRQKIAEEERKLHESSMQVQQTMVPASKEMQEAGSTLQVIEQAYYAELQNLERYKQEANTEGMVVSQAEITRLQSLHQQARSRYDQAMEQQQQVLEIRAREYVSAQQQKLIEKHSEFGDETKRAELLPKLTTYLTSAGFNQEELNKIVDARVSSLFYKAYLWDQHNQEVSNVLKDTSGKTLRRIVRGQHPAATNTVREERQQAVEKAQTSRRESDRRLARRLIAKEAGLLG